METGSPMAPASIRRIPSAITGYRWYCSREEMTTLFRVAISQRVVSSSSLHPTGVSARTGYPREAQRHTTSFMCPRSTATTTKSG